MDGLPSIAYRQITLAAFLCYCYNDIPPPLFQQHYHGPLESYQKFLTGKIKFPVLPYTADFGLRHAAMQHVPCQARGFHRRHGGPNAALQRPAPELAPAESADAEPLRAEPIGRATGIQKCLSVAPCCIRLPTRGAVFPSLFCIEGGEGLACRTCAVLLCSARSTSGLYPSSAVLPTLPAPLISSSLLPLFVARFAVAFSLNYLSRLPIFLGPFWLLHLPFRTMHQISCHSHDWSP